MVAGDGFDQNLECHRSALRMAKRLGERVGGHGPCECDVPLAKGRKNRQRGGCVVSRISARPSFLVEWLDDMMVLGQRLAQTKGKDRLAIGQMAEDLAGAPF